MAMRKLAKGVQELAKCWLVVIQGTMPALSIIVARVKGFRPSLTLLFPGETCHPGRRSAPPGDGGAMDVFNLIALWDHYVGICEVAKRKSLVVPK